MKLFFRSALCFFFAVLCPLAGCLLFPEREEAQEDILLLLPDGDCSELSEEDYLTGVLAGEMPASFPPEALKAQAVAARSYARRLSTGSRHPDAALCTRGECCQHYLSEAEQRELWGADYDLYAAALRAAVRATEGEILRYEGEPIEACFHASSPVCTENSEAVWGQSVPYLVSVSSPETAETVPRFLSSAELTAEELCAALALEPLPGCELGECRRDAAGRVETLELMGCSFTGTELRQRLSLRSTAFTAEYAAGLYRFTVSGSGHGVGMSQYGARILAEDGWDYAAILRHYYPGTELFKAAPCTP